jgi:hypothetical protein
MTTDDSTTPPQAPVHRAPYTPALRTSRPHVESARPPHLKLRSSVDTWPEVHAARRVDHRGSSFGPPKEHHTSAWAGSEYCPPCNRHFHVQAVAWGLRVQLSPLQPPAIGQPSPLQLQLQLPALPRGATLEPLRPPTPQTNGMMKTLACPLPPLSIGAPPQPQGANPPTGSTTLCSIDTPYSHPFKPGSKFPIHPGK